MLLVVRQSSILHSDLLLLLVGAAHSRQRSLSSAIPPPYLPPVRPCCCSRWQGAARRVGDWGLGSPAQGLEEAAVGAIMALLMNSDDTGPLLLLTNGVPAPVSTGHGIAAPVDFLQLLLNGAAQLDDPRLAAPGPLMLPSTSISLYSIPDCLQPPGPQLLHALHSSAGRSSQTPSDGSQSLVRAE